VAHWAVCSVVKAGGGIARTRRGLEKDIVPNYDFLEQLPSWASRSLLW
jgi:hypothetical protein